MFLFRVFCMWHVNPYIYIYIMMSEIADFLSINENTCCRGYVDYKSMFWLFVLAWHTGTYRPKHIYNILSNKWDH